MPSESDFEEVVRILRSQGGSAWQQSVVSQIPWSDTKVSRVVSDMDRSGQLYKLRLGRENLLSLERIDL
ncbi:helix-turn-helix transcriptional regulator [Halogeometricum pallidum]